MPIHAGCAGHAGAVGRAIELAKAAAQELRETIDYFRSHGVRVVNMSWGNAAKFQEQLLEMNNAGGSPEDARQAEAAGVDGVFVGDHVTFHGSGSDALIKLAPIAAVTEKLELQTCVYLLALRHPTPVALAIPLASGGAFMLRAEAHDGQERDDDVDGVGQAHGNAGLKDSVPLGDTQRSFVVPRAIQGVRHGSHELPRRVARELRIRVQGNHVLHVRQNGSPADDERKAIPRAAAQK